MYKAQWLATQAVNQVLDGYNLDQALDKLRRKHPELTRQQRGALQDMSYTTLRWLPRLDALLAQLLQRPVTDKRVHYLLLVALGQLAYGKSPPHAIVDNAVFAATRLKKDWACGLINAVLRNFLRQRETLVANVDKNEFTRLSYPQWWIDKVRTQHPDHWQQVLSIGNSHPPMTLRINTRQLSRIDYMAMLAEHDITASAVGSAGVRLRYPTRVENLPGFADGFFSVQDLGAQLAATYLDVHDGMHVLDACSAPGGKTTHLLELADVDMLAMDSNRIRLGKVADNLQRLGLRATLLEADATCPAQWWDERPFDRILADVPCSASGIVRRHPDIKWLRRNSDIAGFAKQQTDILRGLWLTLAKGGKLLYATCSLFHEENSQQLEAFVTNTPDAQCLSLTGNDENQLLPCDAHDGFYYALLQKN